jgi:hypothetical protein
MSLLKPLEIYYNGRSHTHLPKPPPYVRSQKIREAFLSSPLVEKLRALGESLPHMHPTFISKVHNPPPRASQRCSGGAKFSRQARISSQMSWGLITPANQFFRHPPLASPVVIVWKAVGQHMFLNTITTQSHNWNWMKNLGGIGAQASTPSNTSTNRLDNASWVVGFCGIGYWISRAS